LFQLSRLKLLSLYRNQLTTLPPEIGQLTGLTCLSVGENRLAKLPPEIGRLPALTCLDAANNRLTSVPPEIGQLAALNTLGLNGNRLASLPREIGNLKSLTELFLLNNCLTELPPEIGQLADLIWLNVENNQLTSLPHSLGALAKCTMFDARKNPLSEELLKQVSPSGKRLLKYLRSSGAPKKAHPGKLATDLRPLDHPRLTKFSKSRYFKLEDGYEDVLAAAKPAFRRLLKDLIALPADSSEADRLAPFEDCMAALNEIDANENVENSIDTNEREFFCDLLRQIAGHAGLENIDDILAQRDW
jgi:Leucine-rich repeat (LRR) protein